MIFEGLSALKVCVRYDVKGLKKISNGAKKQ